MGLFDWFRKKDPKDAFADRLRRELVRTGEKRTIRYDKARFCLDVGKDQTIYLRNVFSEYCAAPPAQREEFLRRVTLLQTPAEMATKFEEALPHLIPRVRERYFFSSLLLTFEEEARTKLPDFAFKPLTDHFAVELAYDLPESSLQVMNHSIEEWKTTLEDALRLARPNLQAMTTVSLKTLRPGLYISPWTDTYAPSRVLLPEYLTGHAVKGEPVVALANRDLLLMTGSRDPEGLEEMARRVHQAQSQPRFMTGHALVLSEGAWSIYTPEPDQPSYTDFQQLRQASLAGFYEAQKTHLDAIHERKGIDIYVASVSLIRHKETNQVRSYCVWAEGVDTLLPEADDVVFQRADASGGPDRKSPPLVSSWSAVRSRLESLMEPANGYPVRYRVKTFPSADVLRDIAKEIGT